MENKYYQVNEEKVLFTELDDEGVLFDVENNQYLNLNPTFCSIFKYLQEGESLLEIKSKLIDEYEVDEETCTSQLMKSVNILLEKGYIHERIAD
ncbi:MAG: PqqD family protein [Lunatimonas sp.]|uniref:PqqD family protein n=1 Tax=Lunatimonas sp. TaxID=2060141 RepID=UPI00263B1571|nr:PqqD family protein [Lunatimonas sp.]MCC5937001.1 PqqD family protein [Lunatimonas sp.]